MAEFMYLPPGSTKYLPKKIGRLLHEFISNNYIYKEHNLKNLEQVQND